MTMLKRITADVTTVNIGTPEAMNATPHLGGKGRNAILEQLTPTITAVLLIEGAPKDASGNEPAEDDESWTTIMTVGAAAAPQKIEFELPDFVRYNVTTLDSDGPDVDFLIHGVQ